jgi:hypothetical protein
MKILSARSVFLGAALVAAGITAAQGTGLREVTSPFTEEFDHKIGQTLNLDLSVDGIKWTLIKTSAGNPADWEDGRDTKTTFTTELENLTDTPRILSVIILLEDERGRQLDRVELKGIKAKPGKFVKDVQKIKIDGALLTDTSKVYIFAEVQ